MPRSPIHGSPRRFYHGLNFTDDPGYANFRSPIPIHYIRMIKYYYDWLWMQYGKLRTITDCHEWCRIVSVANPASSPWMCNLGINSPYFANWYVLHHNCSRWQILRYLSKFSTKISYDITWESSASRQVSWSTMPYLLILKKRQNLKLLSAANYRWRFKDYCAWAAI